jgi:hypothetical protein
MDTKNKEFEASNGGSKLAKKITPLIVILGPKD